MLKRPVMICVAILAATVVVGALAWAGTNQPVEVPPPAGELPAAGGCGGACGGCGGGGQYTAALTLPPETLEKVREERQRFIDATADLRERIRDSQEALYNELNGEAPDREKAAGMQRELSELTAQFDRKVLDYRLAVKKYMPAGAGAGSYRGGAGGGACCGRQ